MVTEGHGACEVLCIKHPLMLAVLNPLGAKSHPDHETETPGGSFEGRDSDGEVGLSARVHLPPTLCPSSGEFGGGRKELRFCL